MSQLRPTSALGRWPTPVDLPLRNRSLVLSPVFSGNLIHGLGSSNTLQGCSRPSVLGSCELAEGPRSGVDAPDSERTKQELLWRQFFLDTTLWWDNRQHKRNSRSPDFKHRESKEVLWLNSFWKPDWVDRQLAALDRQVASTCNSPLLNDEGYRRDLTAQNVNWTRQLREAVDTLELLVQAESRLSVALLYSVLKRCVAQKDLVLGRRVHNLIVKIGYESNTFLSNHTIRMYASHGRLQQAMDVFTKVAEPDAFMWSSIISAYVKHGEAKQAIQLYLQMRCSSVKPDCHVFVAALQACASAADLESGRQVHTDVLESGIQSDLFIWNCLVDLYAKCGSLEDARTVFDSLVTRNVVTWNVMIAGYADHEQGQEALSLYAMMEQQGVIAADPVTFASLLKACTGAGALVQGKQLHSQILERGLESDLFIGTCLVDMYAKCGRLEEARMVFDSLPRRDVVTWNAMIAGYAEQEHGQEALSLYRKMKRQGTIVADQATFASLLKACAAVGAFVQGKQLHSQIVERGLESDILLGTCLVNMYAKCGKLEDACRVFGSLPVKNVVTWNAMINGFGQCNEGHKAIECFQQMKQDGVQAGETTFTCLLAACSHKGLVKEGQHFFKAMLEEHGILPTVKHYSCMVDLLGRAGYLDEAEEMLMSFQSDDVGFTSLLSACKSYRDVERGTRCFETLMRLNSQSPSPYVLMGNIYADAGRWSDAERIERLRKLAGASKKPAVAGIEVDRHVHTFVVGEEKGEIFSKVHNVNLRLKEEGGHSPHTELVLKPVSDKVKEDELCGHAEKLALAYGLLNTADGTPLLVTKNLRMCGDCHSSTEILSRVERREIVVRDAHRVHRFVDGYCCCGGLS